MRHMGTVMAAVAFPLAALTTSAQAQQAGIPVYFNPRGGTGVGAAVNLGFPNNDAGGGTAYGVAGSFGTGPVTLTGMVGAWKSHGQQWAEPSFGADVAYKVFGGGLLPLAVAVQAGVGVAARSVSYCPPPPAACRGGATQTTIPVGVGIGLDPLLFPLKPWIAPRVEFVSDGGVHASSFRVSAGVNLKLLPGLSVHAAVDWGEVPSKLNLAAPTTVIFGVGAHFNFHVPVT